MATPLKIAIIGSGNIGGTLGAHWTAAGHDVVYGVRDAGSAKAQRAQQRSGGAQFKSIPEALAFGDLILLAIPGATMPNVLAQNGAAIDGKLVMDATNRFSEQVMNALPVIQRYAPRSEVFRVFNSLGWEVFADPVVGGVQVDHFFAGPDSPSRATIEDLIRAVGLRPIYVGGSETFHWVDALGGLWGALALGQKHGRHVALKFIVD
jgi:predicted dinucleotide-binding enzyme